MLIALLLALAPAAVLSLVLVSIEALADADGLARLLPARELED